VPRASEAPGGSVTVCLRSVEEFFNAPTPDPLNGRFEELSGLDRTLRQLRRYEGKKAGELTLVLPPDQITVDLAERFKPALAGMCAVRMDDLAETKSAVRLMGRRELRFGLLFLAACLFLAGIVDASTRSDGFFSHFLVEGLVIIGWIALWHPVDMLIYERWPAERDLLVFAQIQQMEIRFQPEA